MLGTAVAGSVASFGLLTKSALNSVASLEQNIGGVETLFKDSAQTVIDSANRAYKTAGMSAQVLIDRAICSRTVLSLPPEKLTKT